VKTAFAYLYNNLGKLKAWEDMVEKLK